MKTQRSLMSPLSASPGQNFSGFQTPSSRGHKVAVAIQNVSKMDCFACCAARDDGFDALIKFCLVQSIIGPFEAKPFLIYVTNNKNEIIGGIRGDIFGELCRVFTVWVHEVIDRKDWAAHEKTQRENA